MVIYCILIDREALGVELFFKQNKTPLLLKIETE